MSLQTKILSERNKSVLFQSGPNILLQLKQQQQQNKDFQK